MFDEDTHRYGVHSLAIKAGQAFNKCINIAVRKDLESHNMDIVQPCERLKSLMGKEW